MFKVIGNEGGNGFWARNVPPREQIDPTTNPEKRKSFIHAKYHDKKYCDLHSLADDSTALNEVGTLVQLLDVNN